MARLKYTEQMLRDAVAKSYSYANVLRLIGAKQAGGTHSHIKRRIEAFGIDTSHFTMQAWNRDKTSPTRLAASEILVHDKYNGRRTKAEHLKRALLEIGRPYACEDCGQNDQWNEKQLVLHIDHINGDPLDNRAENLRFLCPNCHSQTPTYNRRKS